MTRTARATKMVTASDLIRCIGRAVRYGSVNGAGGRWSTLIDVRASRHQGLDIELAQATLQACWPEITTYEVDITPTWRNNGGILDGVARCDGCGTPQSDPSWLTETYGTWLVHDVALTGTPGNAPERGNVVACFDCAAAAETLGATVEILPTPQQRATADAWAADDIGAN